MVNRVTEMRAIDKFKWALVLSNLLVPWSARTQNQGGDPIVPVEHRIDIGGGRHLNMVCMGEGAPAVIFENGLGGTILDWRRVQVPVSAFTKACTYDRAVMGYSDPSGKEMTADNITDDLHALVLRSGIVGSIVIVGHSIGGLYATLYADKFRASVAGLVLVDPSFAHQAATWDTARLVETRKFLREENRQFWICESLARKHKLYEGDPSGCINIITTVPEYRRYMLHMGLTPAYWATMRSELKRFASADGKSGVDSLEESKASRSFGAMPMIVLTAGGKPGNTQATSPDDQAWKLGHDKLAARSTRGESLVVSNAEHFIQKDQPEAVIAAVKRVVDEARSNGSPSE